LNDRAFFIIRILKGRLQLVLGDAGRELPCNISSIWSFAGGHLRRSRRGLLRQQPTTEIIGRCCSSSLKIIEWAFGAILGAANNIICCSNCALGGTNQMPAHVINMMSAEKKHLDRN